MDTEILATSIVKTLTRAGYTAYFAGGWVRDFLMNHPSQDIDIATNAPPEKVLDLFPKTISVGIAFGVVIVVIQGESFEVASFRKEGLYLDGRHPEKVEFSSPEEDATRRDFTINGMFFDPLTKTIHDFVGGREDLERKIIRAIGNPKERFIEDRLRMIRAVRFAARFKFTIEPETEKAIIENAATLFPAVARERVWQEFCKMADHPGLGGAIIQLHRLGLLPVIFPSLKKASLQEIESLCAPFIHFPAECPPILFLIELFPDTSQKELVDLCGYLKTSNKDIKLVESACKARDFNRREEKENGSVDPVEWVYFYANPHTQLCIDILATRLTHPIREAFLNKHTQRKELLLPHIERVRLQKPLVSATALQKEGISPGKQMGALLRLAEQIVIHNNLNSCEEAINVLKKSVLWPHLKS